MGSPVITLAEPRMAPDLAPRLRSPDVAELAANGRAPLEGLTRCVALSDLAYAITADDRVLALYGFAPINETTACPWLLASDDLSTRHRSWLLRNTQRIVRSGDHLWTRFWNRVDARNAVHLRWLGWAGFTVEEAAPHGPFSMPFRAFHRTIPCVTSPPPSLLSVP